jgi:ubiquinone/menaquinone biosynthesis C-methylase UbiE
MAATSFDAEKYKRTTREQWEVAAEPWSRWGATLEEWLGEATELMLDLTGVGEGSRVLDIAAGAGGQTITAARRVGASGAVLATDISPAILEQASRAAHLAGLSNVTTREIDGEELDIAGEEPYDAAISRLGLIYFPDQRRALDAQRRAVRPGGQVAAIVYSTPERNEFFSIPVSIIRRRAELPAPAAGQPGPFSLGAEGSIQNLFAEAGLEQIEVHRLDAPLHLPTVGECIRFEQESFGALHQMLAGLDTSEQAAAWEEIESALARFQTPDGFAGPCELLVAVGTRV